jgi:hypothetical protein
MPKSWCGSRFHPEFVNVDFVSSSRYVRGYDLNKDVPFGDEVFDVVYHSHFVEHLQKQKALEFLNELPSCSQGRGHYTGGGSGLGANRTRLFRSVKRGLATAGKMRGELRLDDVGAKRSDGAWEEVFHLDNGWHDLQDVYAL